MDAETKLADAEKKVALLVTVRVGCVRQRTANGIDNRERLLSVNIDMPKLVYIRQCAKKAKSTYPLLVFR